MTPDELRALAGKLRKLQAGEAYEAADYLRACADAQPVAYKHTESGGSCVAYYDADESPCESCIPLYTHPAPAAPQAEPKCGCRACLSPAELMTTFVVCPKCGNKRCPKADDHRYACTGSNAPGQTPQAEPKRELTAGERDVLDSALRSSVRLVARGEAEPKREPLTALRILEIEDDANRKWRDNGRIIEYSVVFTRMIERAHGIGGSDAE